MHIKLSIFYNNLLIETNHQGMTTQILDGTKKMDFTYDYSGSRNTMKYYEGSTLKRSKIYCGMYEKETDSYGTKEICYVSTPAGITAFHLKTNGGSSIFYQHLDHQGSPLVLSDQGGNKIFEQSFDAWGRRRKPTDYSYNNISLSSIPLRGYTGHEMIDEFTLINMNGRIYDPQLCRFLAPDRFVQAPGNSQSFNRYSYCLNNPLKFTDPSGHKIFKLSSFLIGPLIVANFIVKNIDRQVSLVDGTIKEFKAAYNWAFKNGDFSDLDPTKNYERLINSYKIDIGQFMSLPHEYAQSKLGNTISHFYNMTGKVDNVKVGLGYVVVEDYSKGTAFTLGPYINIGRLSDDYKSDPWFVHEFGHTIQSKLLVPLYLSKVGVPSSLSQGVENQQGEEFHDHDRTWFEINANQFGQLFYTPDYQGSLAWENQHPTNFNDNNWRWFLLFNPFIF